MRLTRISCDDEKSLGSIPSGGKFLLEQALERAFFYPFDL